MSHDEEIRAFETVVRDNRVALLAYFQRRLLNTDDSAEAFGEMLLTAWRLHRKMPRDAIEARMWFYGVAHNVLRNSRRTIARRSAAVQRLADDMRTTPPNDTDEVAATVREAIASLPEEDAELVRLIYWDGFTSHEAAAVLGINASTARTRLARAKTQLRTALNSPQSAIDSQVTLPT